MEIEYINQDEYNCGVEEVTIHHRGHRRSSMTSVAEMDMIVEQLAR